MTEQTWLGRAGVYVIRLKRGGAGYWEYVGSSSCIGSRRTAHKRDLAAGCHHAKALQRAWDTWGPRAFSFAVLEFVEDVGRLGAREQYWIDALRPHFNGELRVRRAECMQRERRDVDAEFARRKRKIIGNAKRIGSRLHVSS